MAGALPTFVIIGAQKCGTTALYSYLARHPEISMSSPKELDFFGTEINWRRGVEWYRSRFDARCPIRGESSPSYTVEPRSAAAPARMAGLIPDAKLIYMVRDPVDRVRSQYLHLCLNGWEARPAREAVLDPTQDYFDRSSYHRQLSAYLAHYPADRILVIEQDELRADRLATIGRVFDFVGADPGFSDPAFGEEVLVTELRRRRTRLGAELAIRFKLRRFARIRERWPFTAAWTPPEFPSDLRAEVADRLRDDAAAFRRLTGRRFENWSI